ncbi:MAG TPA: LPS export ABC transporter periplasmic protein LptC [Steroidobacteraceae bacterium]
MILRALAAAAVIALLAIAWLALNHETSGPAAPALATVSAQSPGYSARDAVVIETGADGLPMYTLRAAQMQEQAARVALLKQVEMQFRDATGQLWQGRANEARVVDQAAHVDLSGDVTFSGMLPGSIEPARISTDRLSVDTRSQIIETVDAVRIESSGGQLTARGLVANLREQRIRLESQVHGRYAP